MLSGETVSGELPQKLNENLMSADQAHTIRTVEHTLQQQDRNNPALIEASKVKLVGYDAYKAQVEALQEGVFTALVAQQPAREAELAVREAGSTVMQWRAMLAARTASTAASTRQRRGWELGELGLSEWLLAERNSRQISLAEIMARADAVEARLRVLVDSHELWHTVD